MKNSVVLCGYRIAILSLGVSLLCASHARAQNPNSRGQQIRAKLSDVVAHTGQLTEKLKNTCPADCQSKDSGRRLKTQLDNLQAAQGRLSQAHGRASDADFQEMLRKRGKGKSQGCDPELQICTGATGSSLAVQTSDDYDDATGQDLVNDLTEVDNGINELNAILENDALAPPDPDIQLAEADFFFPTRPSPTATLIAWDVYQVANKTMIMLRGVCEQTAVALGFGGNSKLACVVPEGVVQVLMYAYEAMDFMNRSFQASEVTAIYKRTKNIFDQSAKTDGQVDIIKQKVDAMGAKLLELEQNQLRIIQLLNTPLGQRPSFPNQ